MPAKPLTETQKYAIIDVETTGSGIHGNRITEVCIVLIADGEVLEKYTSLVQPEQNIPLFITQLTGIDNALLEGAPLFSEIAEEIDRCTKDAIFVAHNVNFDYNVIRSEFKRLGMNYVRKKLCTVRLSRKLIPGLYSYSLGNLCASIGIPLLNRHRAEGDTDATVLLFKKLLALDSDGAVRATFLHARSKQATLPPHLASVDIDALPETPGIYLFKNRKDRIIYVGKAKNIKKRVLSHFYDKKNKEYKLGQETHSIDFEETGNELIALLLESEKIQKHFPKFNRAQKKPTTSYDLISYENRSGIIQLAYSKSNSRQHAWATDYTVSKMQERLQVLCKKHNLCPKYCGLQSTTGSCNHYEIKDCRGICRGDESSQSYNARVHEALASLATTNQNYLIVEKGRKQDEHAFISVKDGIYEGFGYVAQETQIVHASDYEHYLEKRAHTYFTSKIIQSYLKKLPDSSPKKIDLTPNKS